MRTLFPRLIQSPNKNDRSQKTDKQQKINKCHNLLFFTIKQTKNIKTDECYPNGNSATDAEKPIRVDIRFHYSGKDNTTEYQFGYVKQKIS